MCEDPATIGCPFYVMDRIEGEVIVASIPDALDTPAERAQDRRGADRRAGRDPRRRLAGRGPRGLRQAHGLSGAPAPALHGPVGDQQDARDPRGRACRAVAGRAPAELRARPRSCTATIASATRSSPPTPPARLEAVLDWEMATIGDPLADLGYLCMMWTDSNDPEGGMREHLGGVTRQPGFPTREGLIASYEQRTGRSMQDLRWYTTLALWKSIVFMEGNYKRASVPSVMVGLSAGIRMFVAIAAVFLRRSCARLPRPIRAAAARVFPGWRRRAGAHRGRARAWAARPASRSTAR